jgi:hypothetical protein
MLGAVWGSDLGFQGLGFILGLGVLGTYSGRGFRVVVSINPE